VTWHDSGICVHEGPDPGHEKTVPVIIRTVTWIPPAGGTRIIQKSPVPTDATEDDLMYRVSVETERLEFDARFVKIAVREWHASRNFIVRSRLKENHLRFQRKRIWQTSCEDST
jgi:hypothetical protein